MLLCVRLDDRSVTPLPRRECMSVSKELVQTLMKSMDKGNSLTYKLMFGGAAIYCDGKVVGMVNEDELFIKITDEGRAFAGENFPEKEPYPCAKPWFFINRAKCTDREWLSKLVAVTTKALPKPKKKNKKVVKKA